MTEARVGSRTVGSLVRQRLGYGEDDWNLALVQRDRVWDHVRIRRLLDSLLAGYPIGSLLICAVPQAAEGMDPGDREVARVEAGGDQLLDGQQRIAAMASLFAASGESYRFFLDMTAVRRRGQLAVGRRQKDQVTDYIKWRNDEQELQFRPIRGRGKFLDLAGFAEWSGLGDPDDTKPKAALARLEWTLDTPDADEGTLRDATACLAEIDDEYVGPIGLDDLRRSAEQASRLLRAWLREIPLERHEFADKLDILEAFERVNLEGVQVAGDDIFFAAVKTAWSNADRGLHGVVERVPVINRMGALRVLARLAALSAGQGDLLPLRVERLNGATGDEIVARLAALTELDNAAVVRMAAVAARLIDEAGPGHALRMVPGPLWDDVLGWAATNPSITGEEAISDETVARLSTYLLGAAVHEYWQIFGETYATRSFQIAMDAGLRGEPFPIDAILAKVNERWPGLRQGRRIVPEPDSITNRHKELFLCIAQGLPFDLPLREPVDPAYPNARVQIEWDHIWPQARAGSMRIKRAPTEGSRSVWRAGNLWALDRPLNTSASDAWATEKLAFLANPMARNSALPHRWPTADAAFLDALEEDLLRAAERTVRGEGGVKQDVAKGAEIFAALVARRGERLARAVLDRYPGTAAFGERIEQPEETPTPRADAAVLSGSLGLAAPSAGKTVQRSTPAWGTQAMAHEMGLGEDFEILLRAIEEANLRIVDYHRDGKAKWAKVGLPDAGKQARVLFWIVPERGVPALALPHELDAFRDLLGIEPDVTRRHFGAERPLVRRGQAGEYVQKNLRPLLAARRLMAGSAGVKKLVVPPLQAEGIRTIS